MSNNENSKYERIYEYDKDNKLTKCTKPIDRYMRAQYDRNNKINNKDSSGYEKWLEYDENNNLIRYTKN